MASNSVDLMTVEQFQALKDPPGAFYELHNGQLVLVTRPKLKHQVIQDRLNRLFKTLAPSNSFISIEVAFRARPEYEFRVADVAYISPQRWSETDLQGDLMGAPDLVIEVLSPSNTAAELVEKQELCLANGCLEFWIVDPKHRRVQVAGGNQTIATYGPGQHIPVPLLREGASIPVDQIFESEQVQ
jgi:Uma2 family endonuclease